MKDGGEMSNPVSLDRHNLPTPQAVGAALRFQAIDPDRLLEFETPALFPWDGTRSVVPAPLVLYVGTFLVRTDDEFTEVAHLYGTAARHGWAWRDRDHVDLPTAEMLAVLWERHGIAPATLMDFPPDDIYFALETRRHAGFETAVDHDATFPPPIGTIVAHLVSVGWDQEQVKDLAGMYVTAFRQRLEPFEKLAETLLKHVKGIANYCQTKVRFGVVEAVNANIRMLINRGRGYQNLRYLLLKAKRAAVTNVEFLAVRRVLKVAQKPGVLSDSRGEPVNVKLSAQAAPLYLAATKQHRKLKAVLARMERLSRTALAHLA